VPGAPFTLPDWRELVHLPELELTKLDIAAVNLACAAGLPGSDRINAAGCLRCLDDWARGVGEVTGQAVERDFRRNPAKYDSSEPLFRMVTLVHSLQTYCGVRYNPAKIDARPGDPFETDDQFLHAAIQGPGGTCASLPVVYAAVGRRLGYPVKLAYCNGHVFCRWDDPLTGARVNVEGTRHDGVNSHPDDHYRRWPFPFDARAERFFGYLRSLGPRGELAEFLLQRAAVWESAGEYLHAVDAAAGAVTAEPECGRNAFRVYRLVQDWVKRLRGAGRIGGGFHYPKSPAGPRRWPDIPWELEAEVRSLDAAERGANVDWTTGWGSSGASPGGES
jgi:hypothetical protein